MSVKRYNVYLDGSVVDNDQPVIHTQQEDDGRYVLYSDYAALEARCAGLERERDTLKAENERLDKESDEYLKQRDESESDIGRIAAAIGQDLSSAYGVPHLIDDIEELDASHDRLTKERDALQATLAAHESHGPEGHNVTNAQFVEVRDKLAAAEEVLRLARERQGKRLEWIWDGLRAICAMDPNTEAERMQQWASDTLYGAATPAEWEPDVRALRMEEFKKRPPLAGHAPATPILDQIKADPQPNTVQDKGDVIIRIKGSKTSFRCPCGCNVFREFEKDHYRCNSCGETFTTYDAPATKGEGDE